MGLAASQARFLGITARKNTCELRSMQIAQEKLSITNQLAQISEDYQRSLDATRLVWDSEYITDGAIYDVSYDLLMSPSILNEYSPQLLTNQRGQIVLNNQYANMISKAEARGLTIEQIGGTDRTLTNFKTFLESLHEGGILGQTKLQNMLAVLNGTTNADGISTYYRANNGLGGAIQEKFTANSMNLATLKSYINTITDSSSNYVNEMRETYGSAFDDKGNRKTDPNTGALMEDTNYDKLVSVAKLLNFEGYTYKVYDSTSGTYVTKTDSAGNPVYTNFGDAISKEQSVKYDISDTNFNLADLLQKEITLKTDDAAGMGTALTEFLTNMYGIMTQFFAVDMSSVDQEYLDFAFTEICKLTGFTWDTTTNPPEAKYFLTKPDGTPDPNKQPLSTGDPAYKHTSLIKNGNNYQISLSNLVKGLLTYFEKAVEGFDSGYNVESTGNKETKNSYYITQDPDYYFFINNPEANGYDDETLNLLDYYSQMFNQLCVNGWVKRDEVDDKDNLKNMLKNGRLFTSTLADDGQFYQRPYTSNNYISEVKDEDAITRAEAEYKAKQLKLNAKEEELNIDMQEVDAELAALTTEFDTVKSLISKAVEKGFSTLGGG